MIDELNEDGTSVIYEADRIRAVFPGDWSFPRCTGRKCAQCGNPLTKDWWSDRCPLCGDCHSFQGVKYLGIYDKRSNDDLRKGIYGLKDGNKVWADVFGLALSLIIINEPPSLKGNPILVAVPAHPDDHPERTYNPPDRLARRIATHTPTTYRPNFLRKTASSKQKSISNSSSRFMEAADKYVATQSLSDEQVFIIDDVMTTGATVSTCALCCLEAGASEVHAVVVGRNYKFLEDREYG